MGQLGLDFRLSLSNFVVRLREYDLLDQALSIYNNDAIHLADIVKEFFDLNDLNYKYTSQYSYMLNPVEFSFGKIKTFIRNETPSRADLTTIYVYRGAMRSINKEDLVGYYRHTLVNCVQ